MSVGQTLFCFRPFVVPILSVILLTVCPRLAETQVLQAARSDKETRITEGSGGQVCIDGFRKCLRRETHCINNKCVCRSGVWRGDFRCYRPTEYHMEILNDPNIHTFTREFAHLPVTCRYLVTHFRTTFTAFFFSKCEVMVHAHNAKWKGKVYVQGYDVAISITTPVTRPPSGQLSLRCVGTAYNGRYVFKEHGAHGFKPNGPFELQGDEASMRVASSYIYMKHNPYDNTAYLEVDACGFKLELRPMDLKLGKDQIMVPGLSLSVNKNNKPVFLSQSHAMGLVPGKITLKKLAKAEGLSPSLTMVNRLFMGRAAQTQYNAAAVCVAVPDSINACPNKRKRNIALKTCFFMLSEPVFVYCFDKSENGEKVLQIFKECIEILCHRSGADLTKLQAKLYFKGCDTSLRIGDVDSFLALRL